VAVGIQQRPMATETGAAFVPARSFLVRTNPYYGGEARGTTNVFERTANKRDEITIGEIKRAFSGRGVIVNFVKYFICRSSERPLRLKNEKDFTESACVCARASYSPVHCCVRAVRVRFVPTGETRKRIEKKENPRGGNRNGRAKTNK